MIVRVAVCVAASVLIAGCGRDALLRCEDGETYRNSAERAPIRVPDDLSVPNQGEALRIPPAGQMGGTRGTIQGPCLESPPNFYEGIGEAAEDAEDAVPGS